MVLLTQSSTFLIGPIAQLLGYIMNALFVVLSAIGIPNIGLAIILFTFVVKMLMMPLTVKQMRFSKLSAVMQPEIQAIQKKYKGNEKDPNSMSKMQDETKAIYEKYGTSPTGGCVQLIIQMPILFALYRVIQNIPAYVPRIKGLYEAFLTGDGGIMSVPGYQDTLKNTFDNVFANVDLSQANSIIDSLNTFTTENWTKLIAAFPGHTADLITSNMEQINHMNSFLTVNMSQNPGLVFGAPILIPIFAGLTQYLSVKMIQNPNQNNDDENPAAASMKMMNYIMPIMSAVMAISLPAGLGLYWIATAVFQIVMQFLVNRHFEKEGIEKIVENNLAKQNKKRAKKGLPPQQISNNAKRATKSIENSQKRLEEMKAKKEENDKKMKEIIESSTNYYKSAKPGSLAEKAGMVNKYNEKNKKG